MTDANKPTVSLPSKCTSCVKSPPCEKDQNLAQLPLPNTTTKQDQLSDSANTHTQIQELTKTKLQETKVKVIAAPTKTLVLPKQMHKPTKTIQKSSTRKRTCCNMCRKKVGYLGFDCRCGQLFCGAHRYADMHNCTFDFLAGAKDQIARDNPLVKAPKLAERI